MQLPPVDQYRAPFIEPLGHLIMQAARADNLLVELCALSARASPTQRNEMAAVLRNWGPAAQILVSKSIGALHADVQSPAQVCIETFGRLRDLRHRAVHDVVDVGVFGDASGGYEVRALQVGFIRVGKSTAHRVVEVTPQAIAELARCYYELAEDIEGLNFSIRQS